ncbi:protein strictosidine synthase-like 5 [Fagus crenata]
MLRVSEFVGVGNLIGPEDLAYDTKSGVIYTGCADGWINRVTVNDSVSDSVVEKWINTGGRPLGIALGHNNELIVADPEKMNLEASLTLTCSPQEADSGSKSSSSPVGSAHNLESSEPSN